MHRSVVLVAAWVGAGAAAVTLATAGVSMVGNQVTGSRPSPLSADEVRRELEAAEVANPSTNATDPGTGPTTTLGEPSAAGVSTTTTTRPGTAPSTRPGSSPTAAPSGPTTTTSEPVELRTYSLVGGTATLRFSPSGVTLVDAVPAAGYATEIEAVHDNGIRVEFESEDRRSRVEGWWDAGPRDQTDESAT